MLIVQLFVSYAHVNLCRFFSSYWCRGLAAASACGSSWAFLFALLEKKKQKKKKNVNLATNETGGRFIKLSYQ